MIPLIGLMYKSFGKHKKECLAAFENSEKLAESLTKKETDIDERKRYRKKL